MGAIVPSVAAAAFALALASPAHAQNAPAPPQPAPATAPAVAPASSSTSTWLSSPSHWTAAAFLGSNFGAAAANSTLDFGGEVGYLYRGLLGGEFLADFAPNFNMANPFLAGTPTVNAYMFNLVGAAPLGTDFRFQPYVSGGFGGVQLRSSMLAVTTVGVGATAVSTDTTVSANGTRFGGDIGAGVMAFVGNVGVRGDIRYFRAFTGGASNASSASDVFAATTLSGLDFWRANIGIALRW